MSRYFILTWVAIVILASLLNMFSIQIGFELWKHFVISRNYGILTQPQEMSSKVAFLEQCRSVLMILELLVHAALWPFILRSAFVLRKQYNSLTMITPFTLLLCLFSKVEVYTCSQTFHLCLFSHI